MRIIEYWRVLKPFFKEHYRIFVGGVLFLIVSDLLQTQLPRLVGAAVDEVATRENVWQSLVYLLAAGCGMAITRYGYRSFVLIGIRRLDFYLRGKIYAHALRRPLGYFEEHGPGKVLALISNDILAVRNALGVGLIIFLDVILVGAISFYMMAEMLDAFLTMLAMIPLAVMLVFVTLRSRMIHTRFQAVQAQYSDLTSMVQELLSGNRIIKSFAIEDNVLEQFSKVSYEAYEKNMALAKVQSFFVPVTQLLPLVGYLVVLYYGGQYIMAGDMTVGEFTAFIGYLGMLIMPISGLGYLINMVQRGAASMDRLLDFLAGVQDEAEIGEGQAVRGTAIEVRNLSFRYPQGENDCLKDISFSIEAGGFVGIVGMTGAGKSTLLKLLLKLYPIERGTICVSGEDITTLDTHQLRQMMGYVPQDSMLFSRSIRDNIDFAGSGDDSKIGDILHMTSLDQCIAEKEDGLDTLLGEKGHRLSGGQKQRVALARALIKQPKILLLDDVFSALDYQTQEQILSRMHDITAGRTVLLVSQRIAAVEKADMILVMEDGKIVERGTHDSLLAQKGLYYQLYARQSMKEGGEQDER